jgi:putative oxidoreductase
MGALAQLKNPTMLVARILLATIFVIEGWLKIRDNAGTVGYMEANGVTGALLPLVILTELGGGLLVAFGLFTRLAAIALAGFCVMTVVFFHMTPDQTVHFYKNLCMAGGFLALAANGGGGWSLDALLWRRTGTPVGVAR